MCQDYGNTDSVISIPEEKLHIVFQGRQQHQNFQMNVFCQFVITSYSIHYTKLYDIFSINNLSYETLDDIMSDIEQLKIINDKKVAVNTAPIETEISGVYFLDLALLQTEFPEISVITSYSIHYTKLYEGCIQRVIYIVSR